MKVSITINNHNYSMFIIECVNSVLEQIYENIEIVIIDDGSTDNSLELLKSNYRENNKIKIISKNNGGQLSAFNEAIKYITGDIVCFLDADDLYKNNYISEIVNVFQKNKDIDFIFCAYEKFYPKGTNEIINKYENDKKIGFSVLSSFFAEEWIGTITSAISMKTNLINKILPIPYEKDWITRGDDCLVWGSSIFGAKKYYCAKPLVLYRIHSNNNFYSKKFSNDYLFKRKLNINKLFKYFLNKTGNNITINNLVSLEYKSRNTKDLKIFKLYLRIIILSKINIIKKIRRVMSIIIIFLKVRH